LADSKLVLNPQLLLAAERYRQLIKTTLKVLLFYILIILTFKLSGQIPDWELKENRIDSVCTLTAKNYIYQKLGKTFADQHLSYYGTYRHSYRVVLFKVKDTNCRHKILPIIFDSTLIDTTFSTVDKGQILNCLTEKCNSNYWIDTIEVLKIARAATDFRNYKYDIQFVFFSSKKTNPTWNVDYQTAGEGESEIVCVNALTGKYEIFQRHTKQ